MKTILVILLFATSTVTQAESLQSKFQIYLKKVHTEILRFNNKEVDITGLSNGSLRQTLFTAQTMAALYVAKYPTLETFRLETKRLEDAIGNYRKAGEQLSYAQSHQASEFKIKELTKINLQEGQKLIELMQSLQWTNLEHGKIAGLTELIQRISWDSEIKEKNDSYKMMASQLTRVDQTSWDMTRLEGQGVHDLRKEVRWYKLQFAALNDIMGVQTEACVEPIQAIKPTSLQPICLVSSCLHEKMNQIYETFGAIKDEGEGQNGIGHEVDSSLLKPAQDLYTEIKTARLFEKLAQQFTQCQVEEKK